MSEICSESQQDGFFFTILCLKCIEKIECVDTHELFTKQGNVVKSLFDNTDSSGVQISVEG